MKENSNESNKLTKEEIGDYGRASIEKKTRSLLIAGLVLISCWGGFCLLYSTMAVNGQLVSDTGENMSVGTIISVFSIVLGIPGGILLLASWLERKKDPYIAGISYCNKQFRDSTIVDQGQRTIAQTAPRATSGMKTVVKVFLILGTVFNLLPISLFWCIPMLCHYIKKCKRGEPVSTGFKVASLLFVSFLGGLFMIFDDD